MAVDGCRKYLAQFPHKKETTYIRWMLAEAPLFSLETLLKQPMHMQTCGSLKGRIRIGVDAVFGAIVSMQAYVEGEVYTTSRSESWRNPYGSRLLRKTKNPVR